MIPRLLTAVTALALVASSCSSAPETLPADVQLTVDMKEYAIVLSAATIAPGVTKIGIRNLGSMEHQFDLIRTDLAPDKLPVDAGKAKEDGLVKQVKNIQPNKVATVTADLQAGSYVVICNIAGHYQLGMRTALKVQ